jgi:hypothetical protein
MTNQLLRQHSWDEIMHPFGGSEPITDAQFQSLMAPTNSASDARRGTGRYVVRQMGNYLHYREGRFVWYPARVGSAKFDTLQAANAAARSTRPQ